MSYRQLLKVTNQKVKNEKFREYLKMFYKQNRKSNIKSQTLQGWIKVLSFIQQKRAEKILSKQVNDKINLNFLFIKHPVFVLNQSENLFLGEDLNEKNAYNIFMMCQIHYLWKQKKIFGKKIIKNLEKVEEVLNNEKTFRIDQKQTITFI